MRRGATQEARSLAGAAALVAATAVATTSCVGTTGSDLVAFRAYAAGATDGPLSFDTRAGWHVTLERARLHVGAVYLNETVPIAGAQATSCILPGVYVAQVTSGLDVDLLSTARQPFPATGRGTTGFAPTAEVWLTGGDVDAVEDATPILDVAGRAERAGVSVPFTGALTIGKNRATPSTSPAQPGANPICKQRIVSPVRADAYVRAGDALVVVVDPRPVFADVDFATLVDGAFDDTSSSDASRALYRGLHLVDGVYHVAFERVP